MRRRDRLVRWLVRHLPEPIIDSPERVLINVAAFLIGLAALIGARPGSLLALWPRWIQVEWSLAMLLGGGFALYGYWRSKRSLARLGYLLIMFACVVIAVGALKVFGWQGVTSAIIFLSLAGAKFVRLLVGSATRSAIIESGRGRCRP